MFLILRRLTLKKFSRTYPASKNVILRLTNRTGTVKVEGWDRPEIRISASMEAPEANIKPQSLSGTIYINLIKDNQGRNEVGYVNFTINVPYSSSVDIEKVFKNLSGKQKCYSAIDESNRHGKG